MAAKKGNDYAKKLKTAEIKKMAYEQYCNHLAQGKTKRSWYFEHPDLILGWESMEKYIAEDEDLDPIHKEVAWCKGYQKWENVVSDSAEGKNKNANTASLQMLMRNKYDWDKENSSEKETQQPLIQKMAKKWREKK